MIRVTREGYTAQERRVVLSASQPSSTVNVTLAAVKPAAPTSARGTLVVDSRPQGARVSLDGRSVGTTPLTIPNLAPGEHVIMIEREGYRGWSDTVRITAGDTSKVAASLEAGR
jgi:hypothetical protein